MVSDIFEITKLIFSFLYLGSSWWHINGELCISNEKINTLFFIFRLIRRLVQAFQSINFVCDAEGTQWKISNRQSDYRDNIKIFNRLSRFSLFENKGKLPNRWKFWCCHDNLIDDSKFFTGYCWRITEVLWKTI